MNEIRAWIIKIENYYEKLFKELNLETEKTHKYIPKLENSEFLIYPKIINEFKKIEKNINFHSKNNPKSSQLLALNIFLSLKKFDKDIFSKIFKDNSLNELKDLDFEWVDKNNTLNQSGKRSNHDVLIDFGAKKFLIELKFTEHENVSCSTKLKNSECFKNIYNISCPLEEKYKTRYYELIRKNNNPYDLNKISKYFNNCPFLNGIQYQLMRYILFCFDKTTEKEKWFPVIIYPSSNTFIKKEIDITRSLLQDENFLIELELEVIIDNIKDKDLKNWLIKRYLQLN